MRPRPSFRRSRALAALALGVLSLAAGCRSVDSSTLDLEMSGTSTYVFRGLHMNDGLGGHVNAQSRLERGDGSTVSAYANGYFDLSGDPMNAALESNNDARFSRVDLGAVWEKSYSNWDLSAGVASYNFPNTVTPTASTSELFFTAEYTDEWYRPRAEVYYDFQNVDDLYLRVGTHPRYEIDRALIADAGFDLGYMGSDQARYYYGQNAAGSYSSDLSDALLTAGLTYIRDEAFRAFLRFGFAKVLASDLKTQNDVNGFDNTNTWMTIGCIWTY